jgi:predicted MFS family arabinose efflux permease
VTPTALALVFTTFPAGRARHRALAVLPGGGGRPGRLDLPGIVTGTGGVAALVYGLSNAATGPDGTSHWGDVKVLAALAGGAAALTLFGFLEARTDHALLPLRLLRHRNRVGASLMSLGAGTTLFGVFFFLTLFVQDVWGYSPLRAGTAFLPLTMAVLITSLVSTRLVARTGPRPLLLAGSAVAAGGLYWMSRLTEHGSYLGGLLGPILVTGAGLGLMFVPMSLVALSGVADGDSGVASSLLNATRQVGGSIGLAVLGTVAWTVVAHRALRTRTTLGYQHALAAGFDRAFLVAAAVMVLTLVAAATLIRSRRPG